MVLALSFVAYEGVVKKEEEGEMTASLRGLRLRFAMRKERKDRRERE